MMLNEGHGFKLDAPNGLAENQKRLDRKYIQISESEIK